MNHKTCNPRFSLFDEIDKGLNHLVKEVLNQDGRPSVSPPLSVFELDDKYLVQCDLPGVGLEDIELQINEGVLEISGSRKEVIPEGASVTVNERSYTDFSRKLQLSKEISPDKIEAELGDGVLTVTVPKSPGTLARKVAVRKAGS